MAVVSYLVQALHFNILLSPPEIPRKLLTLANMRHDKKMKEDEEKEEVEEGGDAKPSQDWIRERGEQSTKGRALLAACRTAVPCKVQFQRTQNSRIPSYMNYDYMILCNHELGYSIGHLNVSER